MASLLDRYLKIRQRTEELCRPLAVEDMACQPEDDVSPPKWHLAHTTWFFEQVVLEDAVPDYEPFHPAYYYLFNSYYESFGARGARPERGFKTRPTVAETLEYRSAVDHRMREVFDQCDPQKVELGLQHEQQHQELLLMDIKAILCQEPLYPAYDESAESCRVSGPLTFSKYEGGTAEVGVPNGIAEFSYDNEHPRHQVLLRAFELADRSVSNGEFLEFVASGGYGDARLWLSDGWAAVQENDWQTPNYWRKKDDAWHEFTLAGLRPLDPDAPVRHVSYYEADAFARWKGCRLPTEFEWEHAAPQGSHYWNWTISAYLPYPGYREWKGALAEYNGKFMIGQMVLRGGAFATPEGHLRDTYRNFFYPHQRWQFAGIRLARDL